MAFFTSAAPPQPPLPDYLIYDTLRDVPEAVWREDGLVVARFLPERQGENNVLRVWNFLGAYERCSWYTSPEQVIKGRSTVAFGPAEVPDEIRAERERLGFDYGKFDFALGPDGPVLYDAKRTPGYLSRRADLMDAEAPKMAAALLRLRAD